MPRVHNAIDRLRHDEDGMLILTKPSLVWYGSAALAGAVVAGIGSIGDILEFSKETQTVESEITIEDKLIKSEPLQTFVVIAGAVNGHIGKRDIYNLKASVPLLGNFDYTFPNPTSELGVRFANDVPVFMSVTGNGLKTHEFVQLPERDIETGLQLVEATVHPDELLFNAHFMNGVKFEESKEDPMIVTENSSTTTVFRDLRSDQWDKAKWLCEALPGELEVCEIFGTPTRKDAEADAKYRDAAMAKVLDIFEICQAKSWSGPNGIKAKIEESLYKMVADSYGITLEKAKKITKINWAPNKMPDFTNSLYDKYVEGGLLFETKEAVANSLDNGIEVEDDLVVNCEVPKPDSVKETKVAGDGSVLEASGSVG